VTNLVFSRVFSISGRVLDGTNGLAGVLVSAGGTFTNVSTTNGFYIISNLFGGTYQVIATNAGKLFSPTPANVTLGPSLTNLNFVRAYTIAGRFVPNGSSLVNLIALRVYTNGVFWTDQVFSDNSGTFTIPNSPSATYQLVPYSTGFLYSPATNTFTVPPAATNVVFGITQYGAVVGNVLQDGLPLSNVTISVTAAGTNIFRVSNTNGAFLIDGLLAATYTVTPSRSGFGFSPPSRSVTIGIGVTAGADFAAAPTPTLFGRVLDGINPGAGIFGAMISVGARTTTTDAEGNYLVGGLPSGIALVVPTLAGHLFVPTNASVNILPGANTTAPDILGYAIEPVLFLEPTYTRIGYYGVAGNTYILQTSTNLADWIDLTSDIPGSNGYNEFLDPEPPFAGLRYYRVVVP
jgi:hypothetical protein